MNMKRAAIICLILMVGICLVPGAFAGKYMVILVEIDSGVVKEVYDAQVLGSPDASHPGAIILKAKMATRHEDSNGQAAPLPDPIISENCIETKFAVQSPGCRYIWHPAGYWVKVCR